MYATADKRAVATSGASTLFYSRKKTLGRYVLNNECFFEKFFLQWLVFPSPTIFFAEE
jgi:hypothetical protein